MPKRRFAVSGGASTILPGFKIPSGSKARLISRNASYSAGAEHLPHERAAYEAVAVFAGKRAAEFEHQVRHLLRDGLELPHALLRLQIDHRTNMQAADRSVSVNAGGGFVAAQR